MSNPLSWRDRDGDGTMWCAKECGFHARVYLAHDGTPMLDTPGHFARVDDLEAGKRKAQQLFEQGGFVEKWNAEH